MKQLILALALLALLPATVRAESSTRIVAVVNNDIISSFQLESALHELPIEGNPAGAANGEHRRQVLDQLIEEQLLAQRASEIGLNVGDDEIEAAIDDVQKQNHLDRPQLTEALRRQGLDFDQYRENLRRQILRYKLLGRELQNRIEVTSRETRNYYQAHLDDFRQPPALHLSRISFVLPEKADDATRAANRAAAIAARTRLEQGSDFLKLLAELEEQKLAEGGDMGVIAEPEMNPAFVAAVKELAPGGVSVVVENSAGQHLLRLEARLPGQILPIEAVKGKITDLLTEQKKATAMKDWVAELRAKAHIEIRD